MNAPAGNIAIPTDWDLRFAQSWQDIAAWRGRCLEHCSRAEHAITETLIAVRDHDRAIITLHPLAGQRANHLASVLLALSNKGITTENALEALNDWRGHEGIRATLAHAIFTGLLDRHGNWFVQIEQIDVRAKQEVRQWHSISHKAANKIEESLKHASKQLLSKLTKIRGNLVP